jgi:hypothetical protein
MIGIDYLSRMSQLLNDSHPSGYWMDKKLSFDLLFEAAKDMQKELQSLHSSQTVTMVPGQTNYALHPSFMGVSIVDEYGDKLVKFYDGVANTSWLSWEDYSDIIYENNTTSVRIPSGYGLIDRTLATQITSTVTSTTTASGGESNLVNTSAGTTFADICPGDVVYNVTQSLIGVVLSRTSATILKTAMFDVSASNSSYGAWTSGDTYIIQPAPRFDLVINPPPTGVELLTIDSTPTPAVWAAGSTLTGATSTETCVVISKVTATTYLVESRSGTFTDGEVISDGTNSRDCGAGYPTFTGQQTVTVNFLQRPDPVYSDYGSYRFATGYEEALIKYACWLYKYRDLTPDMADKFYTFYDIQLRKAKNIHNKAVGKVGFKVNLIKR